MPGHSRVGASAQVAPVVPSHCLFSGVMLFASTTLPYRLFFMFMLLTVKKIACLTSVLNSFFSLYSIYLFPVELNLRQGQ